MVMPRQCFLCLSISSNETGDLEIIAQELEIMLAEFSRIFMQKDCPRKRFFRTPSKGSLNRPRKGFLKVGKSLLNTPEEHAIP